MSYRAQIAKVCDRDGVLIEATKLQAVPPEQRKPIFEMTLSPELTGVDEPRTVSFTDLCPKCRGRVLALIQALALDKTLELPNAVVDTSTNSFQELTEIQADLSV